MADSGTLSAGAVAEIQAVANSDDVVNRDLLERIPVHARTVLHVGCGTGALGAAFKRYNPKARLLGIEPDPSNARIAAGRLDEVVVADVESEIFPFDVPDGIDCLIYDDSLAHVRDPWAMLRRHVQELAPDGAVLASMPNVEHWSLVARLLQGRWDYDDAGLLARDNLRWFTRETARRALGESGLVSIEVFDKVFDADLATGFVSSLTPALAALGTDPEEYGRRATPLKHVWRARPRAPEPLKIVGTMLPPVGGVTEVRVFDPMRCLVTQAGVTCMLSNGREFPTFNPDIPKIFIFHRPAFIGAEGYRVVQPLLASGYVVVTEFDDHPDFIPILQCEHMFNFSAVHAVQTTTDALGDVLRRDTDEVAVFRNAIRVLPDIGNYAQRSHMTLFFGCLNRELDWPPYIDALNAVAAEVGERLRFAVVRDSGFFDALQTPYKTFYPTLEYGPYTNVLSQCELSFMPLVDHPFNRTKSDLKFIEAAACRVTALASSVVYEESVQDGVTGVLFRDAGELRRRLSELVANMDASRAIADAARAWVADHRMLAYQMPARIAWYRSLWARRAELTEALLARVPQLAQVPVSFR
jgi:SAM-dependent methyltransferase